MKTLIKQIFIILLLCIAIFLILAIIFYDSMPISVVVPNNVAAYKTPSEVKEEINQKIVEYSKQNVSFEITDSDLNLYKKNKSYDPQKDNPFAKPTASTASESSTNTGASTTTTAETNGQNTKTSTVFDTKLK